MSYYFVITYTENGTVKFQKYTINNKENNFYEHSVNGKTTNNEKCEMFTPHSINL